jgi:hypothetical protein
MALEFFLPASQGCVIDLDPMEAPADFRRFLCGHAAMLVEFNWVVQSSSFALHALHVPNFAISMQPGERRKM